MGSEQETGDTDVAAQGEAVTGPAGPGERLRAARVAKGWDLGFIAAETRIPMHHLEALEDENFEALPARTYAIGFARNYARAVGLDETEITDAVRAELADESERRAAVVGGMEPGDPAKLPSAGLAWFGAFAAIILAAGVYAFYNTYYASGPGLGSLLASEEEEAEGEAQAAAEQEDQINPNGQVVFTALDDEIWVRFFEEGGDVLLETTMMRGDTFEVPKNAQNVQLNTGRPQFLEITIDGETVPKLAEEQTVLVEPVSAAALIARFAPVEAEPTANTAGTAPVDRTGSASRPAARSQSSQTVPTPLATTTIIPEPGPSTEPEVSAPAAASTPASQPTQTAPIAEPTAAPVPATPPADQTPPPAQDPPGTR
ncbi:MAG: RodZ domain-containing protein [Pseudomonadota bacterium]